MIAGGDCSVNLHRVLFLGSGEDAHHDAGKVWGGGQEIEAADGPGGDFDAPSRRAAAWVSRHGCSSQVAPGARLLNEWRRVGGREGPAATRRGTTVTRRRRPVSVDERHRRTPCGLGACCAQEISDLLLQRAASADGLGQKVELEARVSGALTPTTPYVVRRSGSNSVAEARYQRGRPSSLPDTCAARTTTLPSYYGNLVTGATWLRNCDLEDCDDA